MSWFNKKEVKENKSRIPSLPNLPKLTLEEDELRPINQLPSFPNNSLGNKFSQDTIKEAITGEKEDDWFDADDYENQMMLEPKKEPLPSFEEDDLKTVPKKMEYNFKTTIPQKTKDDEPIFIRLDKFKEGLKLFEKTKEQITQIEVTLKDIRKVKEEEEKELSSWEKELQELKKKVERIENDLFSKLE